MDAGFFFLFFLFKSRQVNIPVLYHSHECNESNLANPNVTNQEM